MNIAFFSDTHGREDLIFNDEVDLFIHCGDLLEKGTFAELEKAAAYFKKNLNGREMLFCPGNHDNIFETSREREAISLLKDAGIKYYVDAGEVITHKDTSFNIYFMPWVPEISYLHSFHLPDEQRRKHIDRIPLNTDILITHGPPDSILEGPYRLGDHLLLEKISTLRSSLKVHVFGHIHEARGILKPDNHSPLFVNCANGFTGPNKPIVIEYPSCNILSF